MYTLVLACGCTKVQRQLTGPDTRCFATLLQIQPTQAVEDAEPDLAVGAIKDGGGLFQHVYGRVNALVLCIGNGDLNPRRRRALLGLEDVA